jgi:Cytochrome C oxidase, cbb3-type, subunit III
MRYMIRIHCLAICVLALAAPICSSAQSGNSAIGQGLYNGNCAICHGTGPNIVGGAVNGANNPTRIANAINGVVPTMRIYSFLTPTNIDDIAAYIGVALGLSQSPPPDYTGAWYNASESGWGLSVIRGPLSGLYGIIMYHYNQASNPTWYFMAGGSFNGNIYSAPITMYSGPFFGGPFNSAQVNAPVVGSVAINFTSATTATITYTISGTTVSNKSITKLDF